MVLDNIEVPNSRPGVPLVANLPVNDILDF